MSLKEALRNLDESTVDILLKNVPFPMAIFNKERVLFLNFKAKSFLENNQYDVSIPDLYHLFLSAHPSLKKEIVLLDHKLEKHFLDVFGELVMMGEETVVLAFMTDVTQNNGHRDTERIIRLHELMLEINHSIVDIDNIQRIFRLILTNALKAIRNAALGSILIKKGDHFEVISYIGYGKDIELFKLPIQHAFIYRQTNGKMDRICNIPELQRDDFFYPKTTYAGDQVYIRSHMSAPIYIEDELYGLINVDSLQPNAFDESDMIAMEFIRSNIQIAIANHFLFIKKSQMAMFDQLTNMYNRHYFNEHFEMLKARALRYQEQFLFVLFDVDDLKVINDHFGHAVGDQALLKITTHLQKNTRKSDIIARYGGDEFVGLFFGTTVEDLIIKYRAVEDEVRQDQLVVNHEVVRIGFSFGISEFPTDGTTINELMTISDVRMYLDKKNKNKS